MDEGALRVEMSGLMSGPCGPPMPPMPGWPIGMPPGMPPWPGGPLPSRVSVEDKIKVMKSVSVWKMYQRLSDVDSYRGFPTRMVYLCYISCLRYTILVGNPRYRP